MHDKSDARLLRDYAEKGIEAAFREIVARHTDLVYSAALRQVDSPDLARDIAQGVFIDLVRKSRPLAGKLAADASLIGWLYRSTRYAALTHLRDDRRRAAHERQAMEQLHTDSESAPDWELIRPLLDEAMAGLSDDDHDAVLLRYFQDQDFRAVGRALGVSDDTAQKRVSRAVERLREFFAKRGVAVGASGLVVVISANAVEAAPAGLALTLSTAATLAGIAVVPAATATITKAIAMTAIQKVLITAAIVAATGTAIFEARQAADLRTQVQTLRQQQTPLAGQIAQLKSDNENLSSRIAPAGRSPVLSSERLRELLKLRGEVTVLRRQQHELEQTAAQSRTHDQPAQPASVASPQSTRPSPFQVQLVLDEAGDDTASMTNGSGETLQVQKSPLMDYTAINSATVATNPASGASQINIEFNDVGKELFAAVTRENLNKRLAIVLDGQVFSAPVIRSEIPDGKAQITGNFTPEEAQALAAQINAAISGK